MNIPCTVNKKDENGNFVKTEDGKTVDKSGVCPTITTRPEGMKTAILPVVEDKTICRMTGRNPDNPKSREAGLPTEQMLEPTNTGLCGTITSVQKDNLVLEKKILRNVRNEYGKQIRKEYEAGNLKEKRGNMTQLEPREDGVSNTIITVPKDNLVLIKQATKEGTIECKVGGVADHTYPNSTTRRERVQDKGDTSPTITADGELCRIERRYRIRKLTPRECWRLMGYTDADFDKAQTVNSNTQLYKQAGNAIVKQVLMAIFRQMNIHQEAQSE